MSLHLSPVFTFRGFFETQEGSCEACDSSCLTCDETSSQCLSCADGFYLESSVCRLNCSLRTYPADDGTCRRCPPHCDVCSDDRTCFSESSVMILKKMVQIDVKSYYCTAPRLSTLSTCHYRMLLPLLDA